MNIPELHFSPTPTHSVYLVCAPVRKCASLLQKCNSMAKNKTASIYYIYRVFSPYIFYLIHDIFGFIPDFDMKTI